jgi:hypothetical protein
MHRKLSLVVCILAFAGSPRLSAGDDRVTPFLEALKKVGPEGQGNAEVGRAFRVLVESARAASAVPDVLRAMKTSETRQLNWLRAMVDALCEKSARTGESDLAPVLETFVLDRNQFPRARRTAFEWLVKLRPEMREKLIPGMLDDPSVELRRDAVARRMGQAEDAEKAGKRDEALVAYREVLNAARDEDQIDKVTKKLRELGETVDLPTHYGFLMKWQLVGPFENAEKKGFLVAHAPESGVKVGADYVGKDGETQWIEHTTSNEMGIVDLNKILGKKKSVVYYAVHEFKSAEERDVELRLSTPNAWKIWLNGELLNFREEYHRGTKLDHHIVSGKVSKGTNLVMVKLCQNDQSESWAQGFEFRVRVCDSTGTAILGEGR